MTYTVKKTDAGTLEFSVTVSAEDYANDIIHAAESLSSRVAIKGFRKGKVPFDVAKREFGEMQLLQEALEKIVSKAYAEAIAKEDVDVIGMPKISLTKAAPGNPVEFTATVSLLPEVKLPSWSKLKIKKITPSVPENKLSETLEALRGMHAEEVIKDGPAEGTDKIVLNMSMTKDGVAVEGGDAKDHAVYLSENHYIPGFNEKVRGMKKGESKTFSLVFPENHYQKHLAGQTIDFSVTAQDVFERRLPEMDDNFAKKLGQDSADTLKKLVSENLFHEAEQKADKDTEVTILESAISETTFGTIPDVLLDAERERMFYELKRDLERHGITTEQYLADIKKSEKELYEDFRTQAEKRAKAALLSREIAKQNNLAPTKEELDAEIALIRSYYQGNGAAEENLKRPEVRDSIATTVQNKKVIAWLKKELFGEDATTHVHDENCKH